MEAREEQYMHVDIYAIDQHSAIDMILLQSMINVCVGIIIRTNFSYSYYEKNYAWLGSVCVLHPFKPDYELSFWVLQVQWHGSGLCGFHIEPMKGDVAASYVATFTNWK